VDGFWGWFCACIALLGLKLVNPALFIVLGLILGLGEGTSGRSRTFDPFNFS
jgi:hypothetical protein